MRISDWSSDVCSSDLGGLTRAFQLFSDAVPLCRNKRAARPNGDCPPARCRGAPWHDAPSHTSFARVACPWTLAPKSRSEEHTSELQSLMRISYAVFCLKKKTREAEHPQTEKAHQ